MKRISALICVLIYLPILIKFSDLSSLGIYLQLSFGLYGIQGYFCIYGLLKRQAIMDWTLLTILILVSISTSYSLGGGMYILRKYTDFLAVYPWYYLLFNQIIFLTLITKSIIQKCERE